MTIKEISELTGSSKETVRKVLKYNNVRHTKVTGRSRTKIAAEYEITAEKFEKLLNKYRKRIKIVR